MSGEHHGFASVPKVSGMSHLLEFMSIAHNESLLNANSLSALAERQDAKRSEQCEKVEDFHVARLLAANGLMELLSNSFFLYLIDSLWIGLHAAPLEASPGHGLRPKASPFIASINPCRIGGGVNNYERIRILITEAFYSFL